jgi:hypothetical protein
VLLVVKPGLQDPPDEVQRFIDGLIQKELLCVLTRQDGHGHGREGCAPLFRRQKADGRIPQGHPQTGRSERKQQAYEHDFNATGLACSTNVLFPYPAGRKAPPQLAPKPLDQTMRDCKQAFNGEEQIRKRRSPPTHSRCSWTWRKSSTPIRDKSQYLLWPENQD